jgi:hypothetical protein
MNELAAVAAAAAAAGAEAEGFFSDVLLLVAMDVK